MGSTMVQVGTPSGVGVPRLNWRFVRIGGSLRSCGLASGDPDRNMLTTLPIAESPSMDVVATDMRGALARHRPLPCLAIRCGHADPVVSVVPSHGTPGYRPAVPRHGNSYGLRLPQRTPRGRR